jgi:hypothetical protein
MTKSTHLAAVHGEPELPSRRAGVNSDEIVLVLGTSSPATFTPSRTFVLSHGEAGGQSPLFFEPASLPQHSSHCIPLPPTRHEALRKTMFYWVYPRIHNDKLGHERDMVVGDMNTNVKVA